MLFLSFLRSKRYAYGQHNTSTDPCAPWRHGRRPTAVRVNWFIGEARLSEARLSGRQVYRRLVTLRRCTIPVLVVVSPPLFLPTLPFAQNRGSIKHIDNEGEVRSGPRLLGVGHPVPIMLHHSGTQNPVTLTVPGPERRRARSTGRSVRHTFNFSPS